MAINLNSMSNDELRALAGQNSADWHGADKSVQDALHAQNVEINRILDARTGSNSSFDSGTGKWSVEPAPVSTASMLSEYRALADAQSDAYERQRAQQEAAVQKTVGALEDDRLDTQAQYAALFRQLYIDRMNNRRRLDQKLAAQGLTGGAAETTRLGYDTAYEDALRQGEQSRISAVKAIDRAIADTRLTGDIESANAAAKAVKEQTDAYADALRYLINRQDAIDARQEQYAREDAQRAAAYAQKLAEQQRAEEEAAEKEAKKDLVPRLTYAQVLSEIKAGRATPDIRAMYQYYRTYGY